MSFYSQQKRAFNLLSALRQEGKLPHGTTVGVIGGGLAGVTASAAAHMLDCDVTLFEANEAKFHQQHGNHTRYIHPNVIDWPAPGSEATDTNLPFLNWTAGDCASVIEDIEDQWNSLKIRVADPAIYTILDFEDDGATINATAPFYNNKFKIVILAVGFGIENNFGLDQKSYWSDEDWGQLLSTHGKTIFVSGTGDGGLIDSMRLALLRFDQGDILETVMTHSPLLQIRQQLLDADREARLLLTVGPAPLTPETLNENRAKASDLLYHRYNELGVSDRMPALPIRRNYKAMILNSSLPTPLNLNCSIINRVIVHWLITKHAIQYARGDLIKFPDNKFESEVKVNQTINSNSSDTDDIVPYTEIDNIIIRHGPAGALRSALSPQATESYLSHSQEVDLVGQQECWRSVEFKIPTDFKPAPTPALVRAAKSQRRLEKWLRECGII